MISSSALQRVKETKVELKWWNAVAGDVLPLTFAPLTCARLSAQESAWKKTRRGSPSKNRVGLYESDWHQWHRSWSRCRPTQVSSKLLFVVIFTQGGLEAAYAFCHLYSWNEFESFSSPPSLVARVPQHFVDCHRGKKKKSDKLRGIWLGWSRQFHFSSLVLALLKTGTKDGCCSK